jgi:hypothetical protein
MRPNNRGESGNIFLTIIIGIVLFAALMFAMSRGMNESPMTISKRQAKVTAADISSYAQQLSRSVSRVMRTGECSESDISFRNIFVSGYEHTPEVSDDCKLFHLDGCKISYKDPPDGVDEVIFTGSNYVEEIGSDCEDIACTDLLVIFKVDQNVCEAVNNSLGISSSPIPTEPDTLSTTKFDGDFTYADKITATPGESSACILYNSAYYFYSVLYAR